MTSLHLKHQQAHLPLSHHQYHTRHHQNEMFREKSQPYPKPSFSPSSSSSHHQLLDQSAAVLDFPSPPPPSNAIQHAMKSNNFNSTVPISIPMAIPMQLSIPSPTTSASSSPSSSPCPSPPTTPTVKMAVEEKIDKQSDQAPQQKQSFDDLSLSLDFDDSDELMLKSTDPSLDLSSASFHHENMFNKSMTIVCLQVGKFLVGREVATLLKRQTFNMYRSMKLRGIGILRAIPEHLEFFSQLGVVKVGTHSLTLVPYEEGKKFIKDCKLREARLEKRKKRNAPSTPTPALALAANVGVGVANVSVGLAAASSVAAIAPTATTSPFLPAMNNNSTVAAAIPAFDCNRGLPHVGHGHTNGHTNGNGNGNSNSNSPRQKASLFELYLIANEMMGENNEATH